MKFAADLSSTIGRVWDADLSVNVRDEYGLSERIMDGVRFDFSHETVNGRPRPRALVINPFNRRDKVNFPQPVKSRYAWVRRMREREEALELICHDPDKTCERDFHKSLDDLTARDEALLRDGFTTERPFVFVVGFDGADNFTHVRRAPPTNHPPRRYRRRDPLPTCALPSPPTPLCPAPLSTHLLREMRGLLRGSPTLAAPRGAAWRSVTALPHLSHPRLLTLRPKTPSHLQTCAPLQRLLVPP